MKKKIRMWIMAAICTVILCGCSVGGYWHKVDVNISINPNNPVPGEDVIVKCSNYNFFDYGTVSEVNRDMNEDSFYNNCFRIKQNLLNGNSCDYGSYYTYGSRFKKKNSDREAVYTIAANAVSSYISYDDNFMRKSTADGCDKDKMFFDYFMCNIDKLYVSYPQYLTLDKTSAKPGDKVTVTSSRPFFDEATFSDKKIAKLFAADYYIVWYSVEYVPYSWNSGNIEKKPLSNIAIDLETLTPTSVTFTVPEDAITGTIHILNEGGFVTDGTNDVGLIGNVANAPAYYSTANVLTITE